ncbi:MAG: SAM-dependent methyltransferase, partial [Mycobacterium sp.]|nr:SAM-dependent methyltransferase [Mycobacterium sp.]
LSPCDSRLAVNSPAKSAWDPDLNARRREQSQHVRAAMSRALDTELPDLDDLWYPEKRTDVTDWLSQHGWNASATTMAEMLSRYGRDVPGDDTRPPTDFVAARRL